MKRLTCVALLALAPAFALAETSWGLVDAVYGHGSATSSGFPADHVKSMWPFHSDETYIAGSASTASRTVAEEYTGQPIARGENDWAPERVYACGRYIGKSGQDANTYVQCEFRNLVPHATYRLDWLASETWSGATVGTRKNTIDVNGAVVLEKFDILAETGAANTAVTKSFEVTADENGKIRVKMLWGGANNARYAGLAVFGRNAPSSLVFDYDPERDVLSYSAKDALTYELQTAETADGPWATICSGLANGGDACEQAAFGGEFFRLVASNGVGVVTSDVVRAKKRPCGPVDAIYADIANLSDEQRAAMWPFRPDTGMVRSSAGRTMSTAGYFSNAPILDESDWAPSLVYQVERYRAGQEATETLDVTFTNLTPNAGYRVDYLGAECYHTEAGKRVFSIMVNGETKEASLDLCAAAGGKFHALTRTHYTTADADGKIVVKFGSGKDCAKYGGIAVWGYAPPREPTLTFDAVANQFTMSAKETLTCTLQRSVDNVHWEDVTTVLGADGAPVSVPAVPGSYFRMAASNGVGVVRSEPLAASPAAAADKVVYAWNVGPNETSLERFAPLGATDLGGSYPNCARQNPAVSAVLSSQAPKALFLNGYNRKKAAMRLELPGLVAGRTYRLRAYHATSANASVAETEVVADANGVCAYEPAENEILCGLELVEPASSDCLPVKAVARAFAFAGGVAVSPVLQCAGTTFEVRRTRGGAQTVLATDVRRTWIDRTGTADDTYAVRAVSPAGATGDWSEEISATAADSGDYLGVAQSVAQGTTVRDGSHVWHSMRDYVITDYGLTHYDTPVNTADYSLLYDAPTTISLLGTAHWVSDMNSGVRVFLRGLIPGMGYRLRLLTADTYNGTTVLGGRVMNMRVNGLPWAQDVDAFKARGKNGWVAVEGHAVASQQGTVYVDVTSTVQNPQLVSVEAVLDDVGGVTGGRLSAQGGAWILDGMLSLPDSTDYVFAPAALSDGILYVDGRRITGPTFLGAGAHRLRYRSQTAAAADALTVQSAALEAVAVADLLSAAPVPTLDDGFAFSGCGDFYSIGKGAAGSDVWRLIADTGAFTVTSTNHPASGEISFRIRSVRDYNEHGLTVGAFAGEASVAAEATANGVVLGDLSGMPLWVRTVLKKGVVTCSVSKDGTNWQEVSSGPASGDELGVVIRSPGARQCQVEIDRLNLKARPTSGMLLIFR